MKAVFISCSRVIEDGRFAVVNVSPVITKRAGREFESIRYPILYDFHRVLTDAGFYVVDEIIWIKPEPSVPDRKYYSFEGDTVLDPFASSGTTGRVARKMKRIPILCEINEDYAKHIRKEMPYL